MRVRFVCVLIAMTFPGILPMRLARAVTPSPAEMDERRRWVAAAFEGNAAAGKESGQSKAPSLEVIENHDVVQRNSRGGKPLKIGSQQYTSGLYCHANSRVALRHLPAGAGVTKCSAIIGVDSNDQTSGGRGSVKFILRADGKNQYESATVTEASPAIPIDLNLGGARELELIVTDAGDGISCDQADWANARITLADGSTWNLGDLHIEDPADQPQYPTGALFSYKVDGKPFDGAAAAGARTSEKLDANRVAHHLVWSRDDGLVARCEGVEYLDSPVVEWTVYLKNTAAKDSPVIEDLRAIDLELQRDAGGEFVLHHNTGSLCIPTDYQPHEDRLAPGESKRIMTSGGRSTNSDLPFFNIEQGGGHGTIVALGWPGQWAATFTRDSGRRLRVTAGQELTHFRLHPGEEVRTPLVVMEFYESGGVVRAQNLWRRWMIAHNMPHPGGQAIGPMIGACSSHQFHEMINADEASQIFFVDRYVEEKLGLNYWWMDAGWYVNNGDWPNTGTWEVDPKRFPRGLRAITDHAHEKGVKSIVWFEPERVTPGTEIYEKHPDWVLGKDGEHKLLNLGNEAARKWWTDRADELITKQGIDLYRTDYNIDPLPFWRAADAEDRQGITEIRYVEGFLAYLDELRARHPQMLIDTCASGGRRNDIETLRRAVPLLRSDYILEPVGQQNHTMGIASWIPFYGTGVNSPDAYAFRSQMCPWITCCYDMRRKDLDYAALRTRHEQWRQVSKFFLEDFYPLTPYSAEPTSWVAWQFDDVESGAGVVEVFRRGESFYESASLKLQGIDRSAKYELTDFDASTRQVTGQELADGLSISMKTSPSAALLTYRRRSD